MQKIDILTRRRDRLREDIIAHLDVFLIGTVAKSPSMSGHGLTTKVKGKTVSLYVRKGIVREAEKMTKRYKRLWILLRSSPGSTGRFLRWSTNRRCASFRVSTVWF
jgi:hypothetical protein